MSNGFKHDQKSLTVFRKSRWSFRPFCPWHGKFGGPVQVRSSCSTSLHSTSHRQQGSWSRGRGMSLQTAVSLEGQLVQVNHSQTVWPSADKQGQRKKKPPAQQPPLQGWTSRSDKLKSVQSSFWKSWSGSRHSNVGQNVFIPPSRFGFILLKKKEKTTQFFTNVKVFMCIKTVVQLSQNPSWSTQTCCVLDGGWFVAVLQFTLLDWRTPRLEGRGLLLYARPISLKSLKSHWSGEQKGEVGGGD